jgi:hypothetical protein
MMKLEICAFYTIFRISGIYSLFENQKKTKRLKKRCLQASTLGALYWQAPRVCDRGHGALVSPRAHSNLLSTRTTLASEESAVNDKRKEQ